VKAVIFDGQLRLVKDYPEPELKPGWAVIRVTQAGICRTDLELTKGYMGFHGVLGHEFVGVVVRCDDASWIGARVVGEINVACHDCAMCRQGMERHCPNRAVLGIANLNGCFAEFCALPAENLRRVPDSISDIRAVFVEPVSAAFQILNQVTVSEGDRCIVLGDGKLGILCAWALATVSMSVTIVGHHPNKLGAAPWRAVRPVLATERLEAADLVVDATGSPEGFARAVDLCRPRGTLVLKSTVAAKLSVNLAPLVVNEITVVGSRCGRFADGLGALLNHDFPLEHLIKGQYPLDEAEAGFAHAARPDALKILFDVAPAG
jgi:alcohol dehydrogenase